MTDESRTHCDPDKGGCGYYFAFNVPVRVVQRLRDGERSTPPLGTMWCSSCGAKWLVESERKQAA